MDYFAKQKQIEPPQTLLWAMVQTEPEEDKTILELTRVISEQSDSFLEEHDFIRWAGEDQVIPVFVKKISA